MRKIERKGERQKRTMTNGLSLTIETEKRLQIRKTR